MKALGSVISIKMVIDFQLKQNGNMHVVLGLQQIIIMETMKVTLQEQVGMKKIVMAKLTP